MLPWFFATNHPNYARWLPVHLRDMCVLQKTASFQEAAFQEGLFTVNKTAQRFSALAIDHAHEQNNAIVKGEGALRRWMFSGPEIARMVNEFQNVMATHSVSLTSLLHH